MDQVDAHDHRRMLLLAVAIVEWKGAVDHMAALEQIGLGFKGVSAASGQRAKNTIRKELREWRAQWPRVTSPTLTDEQIDEEARLYLTKHQAALDQLLQGE